MKIIVEREILASVRSLCLCITHFYPHSFFFPVSKDTFIIYFIDHQLHLLPSLQLEFHLVSMLSSKTDKANQNKLFQKQN